MAGINWNPAADPDQIWHFEAESGIQLPNDYRAFLLRTNGGEGFMGPNYVMFWRVEELLQMNRGYEVERYAPGLLLFGSDGGGEGIGFNTASSEMPIVCVPFIGDGMSNAFLLGKNFTEFLDKLSRSFVFVR